jgi:diguanylate cyclase (GGDEF)-like protein
MNSFEKSQEFGADVENELSQKEGFEQKVIEGLNKAGVVREHYSVEEYKQKMHAYVYVYANAEQAGREAMLGLRHPVEDVEEYFGGKYSGITDKMLHEQAVAVMEKERLGLDFLTGISNRQAYERELRRRWELAIGAGGEERRKEIAETEHGPGFSLLVFDIDHFKQVNDTYGHLAGDEVLKSVGDRLRRTLRDGDFISRIGGEEFAVVVTDGVTDDPLLIAERLRREINGNYMFNGIEIPISISVGLNMSTLHGSFNDIYNFADLALQAAKGNKEAVLNMKQTGSDVRFSSEVPDTEDSRNQTWFFKGGDLRKYVHEQVPSEI